MKYEFQTLSFYVGPGKGGTLLGFVTGPDERVPDLDALSEQINSYCTQLADAGYEIVSIMPLNIGVAIGKGKHKGLASVTRGAAITGRRES